MKNLMLIIAALAVVLNVRANEWIDFPLPCDSGRKSDTNNPKMSVLLPSKEVPGTGRAVIICPGGGYRLLAVNHEGEAVALWLAQRGIVGIVLQYRMPDGCSEAPLADLHAAIREVRKNAAEWRTKYGIHIDPEKVGVMGFSAGGHLASTGAVRFDDTTRPGFSVLIYPVISLCDTVAHIGSRNRLLGDPPSGDASDAARSEYEALTRKYSSHLHVTAQTPPAFLALSDDDRAVSPLNSTLFYNALKAAGVPAEMHVWPSGGHGWGWRENFRYRDEFLTSLDRWLKALP